jgi:pimeloyl-ACP methyl ester carboxylesterase
MLPRPPIMLLVCLAGVLSAEPPTPLLAPGEGLEAWKSKRVSWLARWEQALGDPGGEGFRTAGPAAIERVEVFFTPDFKGVVMRQRTGPDAWQRILLMEPLKLEGRTAGVVVPFYDPDRMCGYDLKTKVKLGPERNSALFGLHLVRQGYVVAAVEAYPFNLLTPAEQAASKGGKGVWRDAARKLAGRHPAWTGMGKLTADTRLAAEVLLRHDNVDSARVAVMGHSLGGKMAFYAGCLDPRFKAVVASDFGVAWDSTNWSDEWYFGARLKAMRADGLSHEQLLALAAPTSFFLIAGQYDSREASWPYLAEARKVHRLYGKEDSVEMFDHHTGHQPSWDALKSAYVWLARKLDMPRPDFAFLDDLAREQAKATK